MEIEIVTTKSKLSRSILNQMAWGTSIKILKEGRALGYIINGVKNVSEVVLIECKGEYFVIPSNFRKGNVSVFRRVGRYSQTKKFNSAEDCNVWWNAYRDIVEQGVNQIYI